MPSARRSTIVPISYASSATHRRRLAAGLIGLDAVDSVQLDDDTLILLSSNVGALQATLPRLAAELDVRLTGVDPLDDSLESVFSYLVET